jgi:ferrochelatase
VRAFLAEFLADPRVVRLPRWIWLPILHGIVLTTRPKKTARKYAEIWTSEGSPLAVHTEKQRKLLQEQLQGIRVEYAMRYGSPGIAEGLQRLETCSSVTVLPLYPQYARSTTESVRELVPAGATFIEDFHDHPAYIAALAATVERHWAANGKGEKLVMSFHGLPRREVDEGDPYRDQCVATAKLLAGSLRIAPGDYFVTFQSRFGAGEWLMPYTVPMLEWLARKGARKIDVVCPGFVSDCLETLEEIGIAARQAFVAAGGSDLRLVPCLNEAPEWIDAIARIAERPEQV